MTKRALGDNTYSICCLDGIRPNKLPEVGRSLGKGIREFKSASKEITDSIKDESCEVKQT